MKKTSHDPLRAQLAAVLSWQDAHVGFDRAVDGVPVALRGRRARGLPWSLWELLEHLRLAQRDILDFCVAPVYHEHVWPADYWPKQPAPASARVWRASIAAVRADREAFEAMALDSRIDLFARVPHGTGQTYLRELLLAADHAAYHVGQMVAVRRALGCWKN